MTQPPMSPLMAQLYALRAQVDALILQVEQTEQPSQPATPQPCKHENREDISTMGWTRWMCKDCGYLHEEKIV